jgi:hypothetical protein
MRRVEYPHNTLEQVKGYLDDAVTIVAELDPPDDLRTAMFTEAARLLSAKHVTMEQARFELPGVGGNDRLGRLG